VQGRREAQGKLFEPYPREGETVLESVKEAIAVGERAGIPVDIIHLKIAEQKLWGRMNEVISLIEAARKAWRQTYKPTFIRNAGNNNLASIIPPWAHEGGTGTLLERTQGHVATAATQKGNSRRHPRLVQPLHGRWRRLGHGC